MSLHGLLHGDLALLGNRRCSTLRSQGGQFHRCRVDLVMPEAGLHCVGYLITDASSALFAAAARGRRRRGEPLRGDVDGVAAILFAWLVAAVDNHRLLNALTKKPSKRQLLRPVLRQPLEIKR